MEKIEVFELKITVNKNGDINATTESAFNIDTK